MKSIASRTGFALVLAVILLFGALTFVIRYFLYADRWVSFPGNPHVYVAVENKEDPEAAAVLYPDIGKVVDRSGTLLYSTTDGVHYAKDELVRRATMHLLGDKHKYIPSMILSNYASKLVGYDKLNGTYSINQGWGELTMTVDAQVQSIALQALDGRRGVVGVYNYKTGEVLCAVTSPTYDPENAPTYEEVEQNADGKYNGVYVYRFFNTTYVPGSIFKLVTCAAALESVPDLTERTFVCKGSITINGEVIRCENDKVHGEQTLEEALANSCNCVFAQIAQLTGREALSRKAEQTGVNASMAIDGLTTARGHFDVSRADDNSLAWAAIGQYTDKINPCQYMTYMGAIANGGKAPIPYLVSKVKNGTSTRYLAETQWSESMITTSAAAVLRDMMANNVVSKYKDLRIPGVEICAKSGTAETNGKASTATFAGFVNDSRFPLAFIVIVEEGGAGSKTCAPIAKTVLEACINAMGGLD